MTSGYVFLLSFILNIKSKWVRNSSHWVLWKYLIFKMSSFAPEVLLGRYQTPKQSIRSGLEDFKIYLQKCKILGQTQEEYTVHSPGNFWQSVQKMKIKLLCPHWSNLPSPITWMSTSTNIEREENVVTKAVVRDRVKI